MALAMRLSVGVLLVIWSNSLRCDGYIYPQFASAGYLNDLEFDGSAGPTKACPRGYHLDYKGRCVLSAGIPREIRCPPGEFQSHQGHCIKCPYPYFLHLSSTTERPEVTPTTEAQTTTTTTRPLPTPPDCAECMRKDPLTGECVSCCPKQQHCSENTFMGPDGRCLPLFLLRKGKKGSGKGSKSSSSGSSSSRSKACPICSVCPECISLTVLVGVKECLLDKNLPHQAHSCLLQTGISSKTARNLMVARSNPNFLKLLKLS